MVLRASPPPRLSDRPVPRGSPVAGNVPAPPRLPLLRLSPVSMHADAITPAELRSARVVLLPSQRRPSRNMGSVGFRDISFRGLLGVHCTFRPASSPSRLTRPSTPETPAISSPPPPLRLLTGRNDPYRAGFAPARQQTPFKAYPIFERAKPGTRNLAAARGRLRFAGASDGFSNPSSDCQNGRPAMDARKRAKLVPMFTVYVCPVATPCPAATSAAIRFLRAPRNRRCN
jgi:hypothetical protein